MLPIPNDDTHTLDLALDHLWPIQYLPEVLWNLETRSAKTVVRPIEIRGSLSSYFLCIIRLLGYRENYTISDTLVYKKIIDRSDVVGAGPTASTFST